MILEKSCYENLKIYLKLQIVVKKFSKNLCFYYLNIFIFIIIKFNSVRIFKNFYKKKDIWETYVILSVERNFLEKLRIDLSLNIVANKFFINIKFFIENIFYYALNFGKYNFFLCYSLNLFV